MWATGGSFVGCYKAFGYFLRLANDPQLVFRFFRVRAREFERCTIIILGQIRKTSQFDYKIEAISYIHNFVHIQSARRHGKK
jgi:hypothetical protein